MKKLSYVLFSLFLFLPIKAQIIKGVVFDRSNDSCMAGVAVYLNGTSIGTLTDDQGNFNLDISKQPQMPIILSYLGYYSISLKEYNPSFTYNVYLLPKLINIKEVEIKSKSSKWATYLQIFKREFLGESTNAASCTILNQNKLRFIYQSDSNLLKAYVEEPLIIKNKALGYTITYYLDKFKYFKFTEPNNTLVENINIRGNGLFTDELNTLNEKEKKQVMERRIKTFHGSSMEFFRFLYKFNFKQLKNNKIELSCEGSNPSRYRLIFKHPLNPQELIIRNDSLSAYLKMTDPMRVLYGLKETTFIFSDDQSYFHKNGYFDPDYITFWGLGDMSKKRIGDLLPYEFSLE